MADGVFNIAKGKVAYYHDIVANNEVAAAELHIVLLTVDQADGTLEDHDDLAALLAAANTEAAFGSYARQVLGDADLTASSDNGTLRIAPLPVVTWSSATTGTTMTKLLVCYAPTNGSADSAIIPLTHHDFTPTTDGSDLVTIAGTYFDAT